MSDIETLRRKLAAVDRGLVELVAERQRLSREIGHTKDRGGRSLRDFAQEKEVIERARAEAERLGVSPDVAEALMREMILYSLTVQEQLRVERLGEGSGQRALIVGGAGRMGGWFVRFLASQGYQVEVADPAGPVAGHAWVADWREATGGHDLLVLAADLRATARVLDQMAERPPAGLVFDIASLKTPLRDGLTRLAEAGVAITSVHPMFGPDTVLLSGQHVIFVDAGVPAATRRARRLFDSTLARQVEMSLADHDRLVAYVLGLSHALNIAFFTALAESGEAAPRLAELSSTTFDAQLAVSRRVAGENPRLYFEIQSLNEFGGEALAALANAVGDLASVVAAGDESRFVALMEKGRRYLSSRATVPRSEPSEARHPEA